MFFKINVYPSSLLIIFVVILQFTFLTVSTGASAAAESYLLWNSERSDDRSAFYKWNSMETRYIDQQKVPDSKCDKVRFHPCEIIHWKAMIQSLKDKPFFEQLRIINKYANVYPYITDPENWGTADYWETPFEFLELSGNCKDYAITKYYSLRMLGIPAERLRLIILQDLNLGGVIHAILGVYKDGELYILDNQIQQVIPARKIYHYKPIYAINETSWWRYIPE